MDQVRAKLNLSKAKTFFAVLPNEVSQRDLESSAHVLAFARQNPSITGEQIYNIAKINSFVTNIYNPEPRAESLTDKELVYISKLDEENRYRANSIGLAAMGPIFGAMPMLARTAGARESVVESFSRLNADLAGALLGPGNIDHRPLMEGRPQVQVRHCLLKLKIILKTG